MKETAASIISFLLVIFMLPLGVPTGEYTPGAPGTAQASCLSPMLNAESIGPAVITAEQTKAHAAVLETIRTAVSTVKSAMRKSAKRRTAAAIALGLLTVTLLTVSSIIAPTNTALAADIQKIPLAPTGAALQTATHAVTQAAAQIPEALRAATPQGPVVFAGMGGTSFFHISYALFGVFIAAILAFTIKGFHFFKHLMFSPSNDLKHTQKLLTTIFEDSMVGPTTKTPENVMAYFGLEIEKVEAINQLRAALSFEQLETMAHTLETATGKDTDATLRAKAVIAQTIVSSMGSVGAFGDMASGNPANKIEADENAFSNILHTLKYLSAKLNVQFVTMTAEGADDGSLSLRPKQAIGDPEASKLYLIVDPVEITNGMVKGRVYNNKRSNVLLSILHIPENKEDLVSYPPDKKEAYVRYASYGNWVSIGARKAGIKVSLSDTPAQTMKKLVDSLNALTAAQRSKYLCSRGVPFMKSFRKAQPSDIVVSGLWRERMRSRIRGLILEGLDIGRFEDTVTIDGEAHLFNLMTVAGIAKQYPDDARAQYIFNKLFESFIDNLNSTVNGEKYIPTRGRAIGNLHLYDAGEAPSFFGSSAGTTDYVEGQGGPAERYAVIVGHLIAGYRAQMECRFINKDATNNMALFKERIENNILPMAAEQDEISAEEIRLALKKDADAADKTDILATDRQLARIARSIAQYKKKIRKEQDEDIRQMHMFNLRAQILDILLTDFSEIRLSQKNRDSLKDVAFVGDNNPAVTVSKIFPTTHDELEDIGPAQAAIFQAMICGPSKDAGDIEEGEQVEFDWEKKTVAVSINMWIMGQETPATIKIHFRLNPLNNPIIEVKRLIRFGQFELAEKEIERTWTADMDPAAYMSDRGTDMDSEEYRLMLKDFYFRFIKIKKRTMMETSNSDDNHEIAADLEQLLFELLPLRGTKAFKSPHRNWHLGFVIRHAILELKGIYDVDVSKGANKVPYSEEKLEAITRQEKANNIVPDMRIHQAVALWYFISMQRRQDLKTAA